MAPGELGSGVGPFLGPFRGELETMAALDAEWQDVSEV